MFWPSIPRFSETESVLRWFPQVLLVSSSRNPDQWIVPGGGMEPEEEPCGAAIREVFEEVPRCLLTSFLSSSQGFTGVIYLTWGVSWLNEGMLWV